MKLPFTLSGSSQQTQQRAREALDIGYANYEARAQAARNNAAPAPAQASAETRSQICARLGLSDLQSSDAVIFHALDDTLAAAKAKRVQVDPLDALYAAAWGDVRAKAVPTPTLTEAGALSLLAWANGEKVA